MDDAKKLERIFAAFAARTRVRIVELLHERPLCVGALSTRLGVTQGAVSQHLRVLRDMGVVEDEKRGCFVHYSLNDETLAEWRSAIDRFLQTQESAQDNCNMKGKGGKPCV